MATDGNIFKQKHFYENALGDELQDSLSNSEILFNMPRSIYSFSSIFF